MKKQLIIPIAMLVLSIALTQTAAVSLVAACHKEACMTYEQWPNGIIEVGEEVQWRIRIVVGNGFAPGSAPGVVFENVVVTDNLGAELELDSGGTPPWYWTGPADTLYPQKGTASYTTSGTSDKVKIEWNVGTLSYGEFVDLVFYVSTDINPAGKQEYTTEGTYYLNSGPTMKYRIDGKQYSLEMNTIMITVSP